MKSWRRKLLLFLIFTLAAIIIGRLFYVQILNRKFYKSQALGQQTGFQEVEGSRGEIFFENSKETKGGSNSGETKSLAINKAKWVAFAVPSIIKDKDNFAKVLSESIGQEKEFILSKLRESDTYAVIKKELDKENVDKLKNLELEGLSFENLAARYYPQESLSAQVVGFLGGDNIGQYGIEGYYDNILKGKFGIKENKRGLGLINYDESEDSLNGSDLYLTIDYNNSYASGISFNSSLYWFNTTIGSIWKCSVRVFDGTSYSDWSNSSNLTILTYSSSLDSFDKESDGESNPQSNDIVYTNEWTTFYANYSSNATRRDIRAYIWNTSDLGDTYTTKEIDLDGDGRKNDVIIGEGGDIYGYYYNGTRKWTSALPSSNVYEIGTIDKENDGVDCCSGL